MQFKRPARLRRGDMVAIVSPSWGGPNIFPHVYDKGLDTLRAWGLQIREYPSARADIDFLYSNPRARARDVNAAFADPAIRAVFASIGGDDSVRLLPFLDAAAIAGNPKILTGYSDTTTLLAYGNLMGLVTLHGPSIMAGYSQFDALPQRFRSHVRDMLFDPGPQYRYEPFGQYCDGYTDWDDPKNAGGINALQSDTGWRFLQGSGQVEGELFGGCLGVLEMMKSTAFWPAREFWDGKILFFENAEEQPPVEPIKWMLRNYGVQGIFEQVSAVLFGRARDYSAGQKLALDRAIRDVVAVEFSRPDLPLVTNMDFGHTDPQFILPLGVRARLDCENRTFGLVEPWLV